MIKLDKKHSGVFAAGVLFGTAGIKLLSSKDAKKVYTNCTAAVLRAKDCVMKIVSKVFMQKHSRSTKIAQQLRKHLKILLKKKHLKKQKKLQQKRNKNKAPAERNCRCFS